jgi:hypothetical protein
MNTGPYKVAIGLAFVAVHVFTACPSWASSPYEGKSIRMVVPFSPGGGTDTYARLIARSWGRNIEGQPRCKPNNNQAVKRKGLDTNKVTLVEPFLHTPNLRISRQLIFRRQQGL